MTVVICAVDMNTTYQERPRKGGGNECTLGDIETDGRLVTAPYWRRFLPMACTADEAQKVHAGMKTQKRMLLKPQPSDEFIGGGRCAWFHPTVVDRKTGEMFPGKELFGASDEYEHHLPRYIVGDVVWMWIHGPWRAHMVFDGTKPSDIPDKAAIYYLGVHGRGNGKLRSTISLPLRSTRPHRYEVTEVRLERVNEITADDSQAEGIDVSQVAGIGSDHSIIKAFLELWNSIYTEPGTRFEDGPWVFVYSFKKIN